jgi:hypothetical protein
MDEDWVVRSVPEIDPTREPAVFVGDEARVEARLSRGEGAFQVGAKPLVLSGVTREVHKRVALGTAERADLHAPRIR